jgi:hypothetical protein
MNYHQPVDLKEESVLPDFFIKNNEIVQPKAIYSNKEYPTLKDTLVKIVSSTGNYIFIPVHKLKNV